MMIPLSPIQLQQQRYSFFDIHCVDALRRDWPIDWRSQPISRACTQCTTTAKQKKTRGPRQSTGYTSYVYCCCIAQYLNIIAGTCPLIAPDQPPVYSPSTTNTPHTLEENIRGMQQRGEDPVCGEATKK